MDSQSLHLFSPSPVRCYLLFFSLTSHETVPTKALPTSTQSFTPTGETNNYPNLAGDSDNQPTNLNTKPK